ncbi:diguanylate cyclase [Altererythrobacter sp. BO-6]|uniref:GGDEF domain-containing protein n=1 Tax=Altererythrobacter sp. BO-6 TaxID=2604537 RepID=UPI0013E150A7|nr:diguanylate cyclase [Altererythrobacter sp. BO-6]QIG54061.1 diguanylate cyclase [Altererythrobacter sp. BO-6]
MGRVVYFALAFAALLLAVAASNLLASDERSWAPTCFATYAATTSTGEMLRTGQSSQCGQNIGRSANKIAVARFDLASTSAQEANYLQSSIGLFESLELAVIDIDGSIRSVRYTQADVQLIPGAPLFLSPLPEITPASRQLVASFTGARHDASVLQAKLLPSDPTRSKQHVQTMLLLAILLGMMLIPVVFDLAFWSALRSPFLLWHAALSLAFASMVFLRSGLVIEFVDLSIASWRQLLIISLGAAIMVAALFTNAFIEGNRLDSRLRRVLLAAGLWGFIASVIHALGLDILAPLGGQFHTYALLPVLAAFIWVMADAYRRGSRAIRFQIVGWVPLLMAYSVQAVTYVVPLGISTEALPLFYIGVLSETAITALGVADRFFRLRRERDQALLQAEALEQLSERDPLTGLHNRRAIDAKFEELHAAGYEAFALVDLDHFKPVNDTAGHLVGDEVLKVVARVLDSDAESLALRMGGEEFLLAMRGKDAPARAEKIRNAIPIRVAQEIPELEQFVTASVGLLVAPRKAVPMANFSDIYSRVDMLLYEAKAQGRNRMVSEKLQAFDRRTGIELRKGERRQKEIPLELLGHPERRKGERRLGDRRTAERRGIKLG